jgi:shikimate 5-dehydrogenase/shikimate kinase
MQPLPLLTLVIGHRGVGKTTFLRRVHATYDRRGLPVQTWDLDAELARHHGTAVATLFREGGEARFREHEHAALRALLAALKEPAAGDPDRYVALGAGYDEDPRAAVPPAWRSQVRVLWLRRLTDPDGRVFVDPARPRLDPGLSPLLEFRQRFGERKARYQAWHDLALILPEGAEVAPSDSSPPPESDAATASAEDQLITALVASQPQPPVGLLPAVLTLLPQPLARPEVARDFLARRLSWLGLRFELRDDLLTDDLTAWVCSLAPAGRLIFSARRALPSLDGLRTTLAQGSQVDLPCELLQTAEGEALQRAWVAQHVGAAQAGLIVSLHERRSGESVATAAARLQATAARLGAALAKLAIEIEDFAELEAGLAWAESDPQRRAFLPRTPTSQLASGPERYRWFRAVQVLRQRSPLSFVREGDGSSPDQPTLCEHLLLSVGTQRASPRFAAVLGDPVQHSRSPSEHRAFFAAHGLPVLAIPCREADFCERSLLTLRSLGLRFSAVTAPLKRAAGALTGLPSCNTLWWREDSARWQGDNTDPAGLRALLSSLPPDAEVAVWGGGGVLPSLAEVLPKARAFSLRTGSLRSPEDPMTPHTSPDAEAMFAPRAVVWAAGHHSRSAAQQPPASWQPEWVYDLDYREDSAGRDYALRVGARYVSGLPMFAAQAAAQRAVWAPMLAALP